MAEQVKSTQSKPRLGRGLSSLIINSAAVPAQAEPAAQTDHQASTYVSDAAPAKPPAAGSREIPIDQIGANPYQPRREFDAEELAELTQSIIQQGVLQPIVVTAGGEGSGGLPFVLIAGERRLRAAKQAGLTTIPCIIRQASRQQMLEWALIENIQRANLNPVERANAYRDYMDRFGLTAAQIADKLGEPRTTIANYLRIIDLCDDIQKLLIDGKLTFGHAKVLAGLSGDPAQQLFLAHQTVEGDLSVRYLEGALIRWNQAAGQGAAVRADLLQKKAAYIRDLEERLSDAMGTRVAILPGKAKNSGRIVIGYYTLDDFDRITAKLGMARES